MAPPLSPAHSSGSPISASCRLLAEVPQVHCPAAFRRRLHRQREPQGLDRLVQPDRWRGRDADAVGKMPDLQPERAIDYAEFNRMGDRTKMTGTWLAYCAACPVPELINVFHRSGIRAYQVTGVLRDDPHVDAEIDDWIEAARVAHVMAHNRLGVMGHYYAGMLDIYSDLTAQSAAFGTIIDFMEIDELAEIRRGLSAAEVDAMLARNAALAATSSTAGSVSLTAPVASCAGSTPA